MPYTTTINVTCNSCGSQAPNESAETDEDAMKNACDHGWAAQRVAKGSWWGFCPKCWAQLNQTKP